MFGAVLSTAVAAVWLQQSPGAWRGPLTRAEVADYVARLTRMPMAPEERTETLARLRAFGEADDGNPVHMLNVMRFYDEVRQLPGAPAFAGTSREANAYYEARVAPFLLRRGAYPMVSATVVGANLFGYEPDRDHADRVLVVRYPSRRAFLDMVADPAYGALAPYKLMAVNLMLTPTRADHVIPDVRIVVTAIALICFLAVGWLRAARTR